MFEDFFFCSIGGDGSVETVTTLPSELNTLHFAFFVTAERELFCRAFFLFLDILKMFNSKLKGFSVGQLARKGFNMAEPGAKSLYVLIVNL